MHPLLFSIHIGGSEFNIMAYSFFYFLAVCVVLFGGWWYMRKSGCMHGEIMLMMTAMSVSGLCGARLMHVATNTALYSEGVNDIFALHMSNFAITGGIIGAVFGGIVMGYILRIDLWTIADRIVPFLGIGIAIARIGCFLNGCCFGHVTTMPWGVQFPLLSQAHIYQLSQGIGGMLGVVAVHPTQIYELVGALIGVLGVFVLIRKKAPSGIPVAFFGAWFAVVRFIIMHMRVYPDSLNVSQWFYPTLYIMVILICSGIIYWRWISHEHEKNK